MGNNFNFLILGGVAFSIFLCASLTIGFAASFEEASTSSSVTINSYVDITLSQVPVKFGSIDPGTTETQADDGSSNDYDSDTQIDGFPMRITVESTTNEDVDIHLKGDDWSDGGTNSFGIGNVTIDDDSTLNEGTETGLAEDSLTTAYGGANTGYFEDITAPSGGPAVNKDLYFWLDVPSAQAAGAYSTTIYVKAVKNGDAP
jgi:spore coat protein CotH